MKTFLIEHKKIVRVYFFITFLIAAILFFTFAYPLFPAKSIIANDDIRMHMAQKYLNQL